MRAFTALAVVLIPFAAAAQEQPTTNQRPVLKIIGDYNSLTLEDRNAYCFWAGQLYSVGASFCSRQQTLTSCTEVAGRRPMWVNKDNDKNCDKNPSTTPQ
jgi:hypothetical protein